jgi:hypothetical protein
MTNRSTTPVHLPAFSCPSPRLRILSFSTPVLLLSYACLYPSLGVRRCFSSLKPIGLHVSAVSVAACCCP